MSETTCTKEFIFLHHVALVKWLCEEFLENRVLNCTSEDIASVPRDSQCSSSKNKGAILNSLHMWQLFFLMRTTNKIKEIQERQSLQRFDSDPH